MLTNKQEVAFFSFLGVILLAFFVGGFFLTNRANSQRALALDSQSLTKPINVDIKAKSAYVFDIKNDKVLFSKNENEKLPLASLTKLMSAVVASDLSSMDNTVTIASEALKADGDVGLLSGERWKLKDLLDFSLVSSSNDGITAIALSLGGTEPNFVAQMNAHAATLGMKDTYYLDPTGLDISTSSGGAYGSAKDEATLLSYILKYRPTLVEATRNPTIAVVSLDGIHHEAKNTNLILGDVPRILASKTGYTDLAGGNLIMAFDSGIGHPIIISILGSTESGRFEDMQKIVNSIIDSE